MDEWRDKIGQCIAAGWPLDRFFTTFVAFGLLGCAACRDDERQPVRASEVEEVTDGLQEKVWKVGFR